MKMVVNHWSLSLRAFRITDVLVHPPGVEVLRPEAVSLLSKRDNEREFLHLTSRAVLRLLLTKLLVCVLETPIAKTIEGTGSLRKLSGSSVNPQLLQQL